MGRKKRKPTNEILANSLPPEKNEARDLAMFKAWLTGKTLEDIGKEHNLSKAEISRISTKYGWKELRRQLKHKQFKAAMEEVKNFTLKVQKLLRNDIDYLVAEVAQTKRLLSDTERTHLRSLYDRLLKEVRLEDGKPTDITEGSGAAKVEIILPPTVTHFGIIPPDPRVKQVPVQVEEKPLIDVSTYEDEVDEK